MKSYITLISIILFLNVQKLVCVALNASETKNTTDTKKTFCDNGTQQSPINIVEEECKTKEFTKVVFLDDILFNSEVNVENNCETVRISVVDKTVQAKVQGGALGNDTYLVSNIHFHWGAKQTEGCEHTIGGKHYPMESHVVLYKNTYKSFEEALENKGVAVLGFMFEMQKEPDEDLKPLVHAVTQVLQPHSSYKDSGKILDFLKNYISSGFFSYVGSLTTNNCAEGVLWTIFKKTIPIAKTQLLIFHDVIGEDGDELQNWRNIRPLNNREVCKSSF